jgi:uncharacterized protein YlxW (UPF0749 family)
MPDQLDRARTPLLTLITQESLDRDYQVAADRRGEKAQPEGRRAYRIGVIAVIGAFAMLVTVAGVQTSENADVNDASRASLIKRVEDRRAVVSHDQDEIARLRRRNTDAEAALSSLGRRYASVQARVDRLGALTGFEPVTGSGVRVKVDNAPNAGDDQQIRDSDLSLLVNGLWQAGAEAIAVNGQRLSPVTAIRNSGIAIEVNSVGIAPPYTIEAVGDRRTLAANFVESESGLQFVALVDQFGFTYRMDTVTGLRLPAAPDAFQQLRSAKQIPKNHKRQGGETP